jgi:hypothetical protein
MLAVLVRGGVDTYSGNSHSLTGVDHPDGDLPSVRDQHFLEHLETSGACAVACDCVAGNVQGFYKYFDCLCAKIPQISDGISVFCQETSKIFI